MTIDTEFLDMMPDTITVVHSAGLNKYAEQQYTDDTEQIRARIVYKTQRVLNQDAELELAKTKIYCYGANALETDDKIVLSDGKLRNILHIDTYPDEDGLYYNTIFTT